MQKCDDSKSSYKMAASVKCVLEKTQTVSATKNVTCMKGKNMNKKVPKLKDLFDPFKKIR